MDTESISEEYSLTWKGHVQHVRDSFTKLWQNNDFCDVTLYAEGHKIGAHKVLLTACSGYFSKLFEDFKEEKPIVVLKGVQFDVLQHILKFIYNGEVSIEVDKLNAFLETAEFLNIFGLIKDKMQRKRTNSAVFETDHACNTVDYFYNQESDEPPLTNKSEERQLEQKAGKIYRIDIMSVKENPLRESNSRNWPRNDEGSGNVEADECPGVPQNCTLKRRKINLDKHGSRLGQIKEVETMLNQDLVDYKDISLAPPPEDGFKSNKLYPVQHALRKRLPSPASNTTCLVCGITLSRRSILKRHLKLHEKFGP